MSVSKLESLPNEILIDIFEKYMNGIDILVAFAYCQNQRFDALISQCQRFHFNFFNCRKDDFRFCIGLLPAYIEKIEELVLSELNTPGQIHAFLSFFPTFVAFKRLRKLYFHFDFDAVDWVTTERAILSLCNTPIDTVLIKAMKTNKITLNPVIAEMFRLRTIKRLFLNSDYQPNRWNFLTNISSNVEYLTISGMSCGFEHLQTIFRCASHLKYVNVQLTSISSYGIYHLINPSADNIISMPTLQTLILSFGSNDPTTFDMLAQYLKAMSALRHLEIKAHSVLLEANAWEALLQTSLPLLTYFSLKTMVSRIKQADIENILASFETPFWRAKKNFYMIITKHKYPDFNSFGINNYQDEFNLPVVQWWIVPCRTRIDDIPTNEIINFGICGTARFLSHYHYFKNVKQLVIYNLDKDLLEWLVTYVNYSRIRYLDVSHLNKESNTITSLLSCVKNITSLRIQYSCLLAHQDAYLGKDNCLKYLDISVDGHSFDKKDIITISRVFPNIEHLTINAITLSNIPILNTYLPYLCSITFKIIDSQFPYSDDYAQKLWDYQLRQKVQFFFRREGSWITVWIDQTALKESYWQTCSSDLSRSSITSMLATTLKRTLPFFK